MFGKWPERFARLENPGDIQMIRAGNAVGLIAGIIMFLGISIFTLVMVYLIFPKESFEWFGAILAVVFALSGFAFVYVALTYFIALRRRGQFSITHEGNELVIKDHLGLLRIKADDIEAYYFASRVKIQLRSDMGVRSGYPFTNLEHFRLIISPGFMEGDVKQLLEQFDPQLAQKDKFNIEGFLDKWF